MTPARLFPLCAAAALLFWGVRQTATPPPDSALFAGDSWEYHSMGVNFARGHGLVAGRREPLDDYRFDGLATHPRLLEHFEGAGRDPRPYHTYRTPAYPLFLGLVYRTAGTSPRRAYQVQELLLILMAFALPPAGLWIAGNAGAAAGLFSGIWFLSTGLDMGTELMTETLIVVHLFLMFLAFHAAGKNRTPLRMALWGLAAGLAPLVKGSLVFMPGLAFLLEALAWRRHRDRRWRPRLAFLAALGLPLALWSAHIRRIEGRPVFLSTQGNAVLLEGNNELSLLDGAWHPEYKAERPFWIESGVDTSALYYNRPDVRAKSIPAQLAGFFVLHAKQAPRLFLNKFNRAFERFPPFKALVVTVLWLALAALLRLPPGATAQRLGLLGLLLGGGFALRYVHPSFAEIGVWVAAATPAAALAAWKRGLRLPLDPFTVIAFVNFTLITLMTFGLRRFVQVLDPLLLYTTGLVVWHAAALTFSNKQGEGRQEWSSPVG
ncbi:MAG: hypothetical protein U1F77_02835 [Kiritimatiellia bacterium]